MIFAAESLWRIKAALTELVQEGPAEGVIRHGDPWILTLGIISHPVHFSLMARCSGRSQGWSCTSLLPANGWWIRPWDLC